MENSFISKEKPNTKKLIEDLSKALNIDINKLNFLNEQLNTIIINSNPNSLQDILRTYFNLLEKEMSSLITKRITPAFQFGIKNEYFTFIGYTGQFNITTNSDLITDKTYFSLDSISKTITSILTMLLIRDGKISLETPINSFNKNFNMDASIESILKFTAMIQTEKRIDNLSTEETIQILKNCRENLEAKQQIKNYYQYNDLGYMILRLSIPDFLDRLDQLLLTIDNNNLTYQNIINKDLITGGKIGSEHITPDPKGRDILFPGHTGLYSNIEGIMNFFNKAFYTNSILTKEELDLLLKQPYTDPHVYNKDGNIAINKNGSNLYIAKVGGLYRKPNNIIDPSFDKITSCDFSNLTTNNALASAGTCGSWVVGDDLTYQNKFGPYIGAILSNPYSSIKNTTYPDIQNQIPNTNLIVNQKGVIFGYSGMLNRYKETITNYGLLLELLTEYLKETNLYQEFNTTKKTYIKKLII